MNDDENYYGFIYLWENTHPKVIEYKFYIGQHIGNTDDGYIGSGVIFIKKFYSYKYRGYWKRTIITKCRTQEELNAAEERIIKEHNAVEDKLFCNYRYGGKNGKHSEETKRKISKKCKGRLPWNKGLVNLPKHSAETKAKRLESKKKFYNPIFKERKNHVLEYIKSKGSIKIKELSIHANFTLRTAANTVKELIKENRIKEFTFGYNDIRYILLEKDFKADILQFIKITQNVTREMIVEKIKLSKGTNTKLLLELQKENKIRNIRGYRKNYFIIV